MVELGIRSLVLTPIQQEDEVVGVLTVFASVADAFTAEHLAHLEAAAGEISVILGTPGADSLPLSAVPPAETGETLQPSLVHSPTARRKFASTRLILTLAAVLLLAAGVWSYLAIFGRPAWLAARKPPEMAAATPVKATDATRTQAALTIEPGAVMAKMADTFTLTVTVSRVSQMTSAGAQISYDAGLLQFVQLAGGGILASGQEVVLAHRDDPETGVLKVNAQRPARSLSGDSAVLDLVFRPRKSGNGMIIVAVAARDSQGRSFEIPEGHAEVTVK